MVLSKHEIMEHTVVCEYRKIPCSLGCGLTVPLRNMTEHAFTSCMNAKILCWQGCGVQIERANIQRHIDSECGKTTTTCPVIGCNVRVQRDDVTRHLSAAMYEHTLITTAKIAELDNRVQQLEARLSEGSRTMSQQAETIRRQDQQLLHAARKLDDMEWRHMDRKEDVANVLAVVADDDAPFDSTPTSATSPLSDSHGPRPETASPSVQQYEQIGEERGVEGVISTLCQHALDPHSQEAGMKVLQHLANNGKHRCTLSAPLWVSLEGVFVVVDSDCQLVPRTALNVLCCVLKIDVQPTTGAPLLVSAASI